MGKRGVVARMVNKAALNMVRGTTAPPTASTGGTAGGASPTPLTYVAGKANPMLSSFDPAARPPMSKKWIS